MSDSIVIIPTYNEKENIEKMILKVMSLDDEFHLLVVDDGSPDGTGAIVKGLQCQADKDFLADNRVISTVKHFLGDGGTDNGKDQGDTLVTEQELFDIHAQGYVGGLQA